MKILLEERYRTDLSWCELIEVVSICLLGDYPHFVVNPKSTAYPHLKSTFLNSDMVSFPVAMQARHGNVLIPFKWVAPIEIPYESYSGDEDIPFFPEDGMLIDGKEKTILVTLNESLWETLSGEFDPAVTLGELLIDSGYEGCKLPEGCLL